jgi:kynurenine formamidase
MTAPMTALPDLLAGLSDGSIEVVDLTAALSERTPVIRLPEPFVNTPGFSVRELSRYDERGPAWYWNAFEAGEHVGTHFDAPIHWVTGRDSLDVAQVPVRQLIGPAVVIDKSRECAENPDFLLEIDHVKAWEADHGPLPDGAWLLYRTGWDARGDDQAAFLNADETGPHTPGLSVDCARWLAEESPILGLGVETVGTDAGTAHSFDPPFPCHAFLLGAGKYGLTQLANVARLPVTGAVLIAAPLPIERGSGSPCRVLALVPH